MALDWVAPLIEGATALTNTTIQAVTNRKNRQFQNEQNEITRQREDTAHQREVADLQAAGLSPLATMGGAQTSTPLASEMEAPTIDTSAIRDALALNEQKREFDADLEERKNVRLSQESEGEKNRQVQKDMIKSNEEIAKKNRESAEKIANNQIKKDIDIYNSQTENLNVEAEKYINEKNYENAKSIQEMSEDYYQNFTKTFGWIETEEYTEIDKYLAAKNDFETYMGSFTKWIADNNLNIDPVISESGGTSTNANMSLSTGPGTGTGAGAGTSGNKSITREGEAARAINTRKLMQSWKENDQNRTKFYNNYKYPIFRATRKQGEDYKYSSIKTEE